MNDTHQVSAYAVDVNLIGDNIRTIERNSDVLLNACKDIGSAVNSGKTKNLEVGGSPAMIANGHIAVGSNSYEKLKTFKYLGLLLTNKNSIYEEIECRHKSGNCCCSVETILSSQFLSKLLKIKIYKTIILAVVLYGCKAWSLKFKGGTQAKGI